MAAAPYYLPRSVSPDVPALAHLFMNYMLDLPNVLTNISFNGYRPQSGRRR
jgi:hypothetical protein